MRQLHRASMGPRFCTRGNPGMLIAGRGGEDAASMGPRFCKRGNNEAQGESEVDHVASMGPRFCKRGNLTPAAGLAYIVAAASMGPRFCKRGNARSSPPSGPANQALQWGHAFVSVETGIGMPSSCKLAALQWGHAFVSVETASRTVGQVYHLSSPLRPEVVRQAHILVS